MRIKLKLSRKLSFALVATLALLGLGGVTAAQVITVNNNVSLNMGSGAVNTAACDNLIRIGGGSDFVNICTCVIRLGCCDSHIFITSSSCCITSTK